MRDVAALAGVALKTVSRVMNGEPRVAPDLAARVHDAAEKLGYRPNLLASSLRRSDGRTATVGLLLDDVANPFSAALLRAVEDAGREREMQVLIGSLDHDPERERQVARSLIDRNVDGLVMVPAGPDQSYLQLERRRGVRVVFLDREPRLFSADAIVSDNRGGATRAVEHLLAAGHRRIAYLGDDIAIWTAEARFTAMAGCLERAGLPLDTALVRHGLRTLEAAARTATELLQLTDPPTALFASQNLVTIGAAKAIHALGVGHEIALVGFDDFLMADVFDPGITVITQDTTVLGSLAAQRLFARLDGDDSAPLTHVVPTGIVVRGSGEVRPPGAV